MQRFQHLVKEFVHRDLGGVGCLPQVERVAKLTVSLLNIVDGTLSVGLSATCGFGQQRPLASRGMGPADSSVPDSLLEIKPLWHLDHFGF
jgi:hypothetical protein